MQTQPTHAQRDSYTPKPDVSYAHPTQVYNNDYDDIVVSQVRFINLEFIIYDRLDKKWSIVDRGIFCSDCIWCG